jgi:hypothetical protein
MSLDREEERKIQYKKIRLMTVALSLACGWGIAVIFLLTIIALK